MSKHFGGVPRGKLLVNVRGQRIISVGVVLNVNGPVNVSASVSEYSKLWMKVNVGSGLFSHVAGQLWSDTFRW